MEGGLSILMLTSHPHAPCSSWYPPHLGYQSHQSVRVKRPIIDQADRDKGGKNLSIVNWTRKIVWFKKGIAAGPDVMYLRLTGFIPRFQGWDI